MHFSTIRSSTKLAPSRRVSTKVAPARANYDKLQVHVVRQSDMVTVSDVDGGAGARSAATDGEDVGIECKVDLG